ncbi:hypothetical protein B0H11DRAFT_2263563 [Mycena galericulata]|nr:hypothetical protein B0H11DRAFT_2263563 [Mycena galericulata]
MRGNGDVTWGQGRVGRGARARIKYTPRSMCVNVNADVARAGAGCGASGGRGVVREGAGCGASGWRERGVVREGAGAGRGANGGGAWRGRGQDVRGGAVTSAHGGTSTADSPGRNKT